MKNYELMMLTVAGAKPDIVQTSGPMVMMEYPVGAGKADNWITVVCDMRLSQAVTVTIIINANGEIIGGARFYEVTNFFTKEEFDYVEAIDLDSTEAENAIDHIVDYMNWYDDEIKKLEGRGV